MNALQDAYEWLIDLADRVFGPAETGRSYVGQHGFKRTLQMDSYTCGPCSVFMVLRYFGVPAKLHAVARGLRTGVDGTDIGPILTYLRRRGLAARSCRMTMSSLEGALARGSLVIALLDTDHLGVVYGLDSVHVHVADPAPSRSLFTRVRRRSFQARWDREAIVVRQRGRRARRGPGLPIRF